MKLLNSMFTYPLMILGLSFGLMVLAKATEYEKSENKYNMNAVVVAEIYRRYNITLKNNYYIIFLNNSLKNFHLLKNIIQLT